MVTGPPVQPPINPADLNLTIQPLWKTFSGQYRELPSALGIASWVDVRDVSAVHIWCAEHARASNGQRYLVSTARITPQATADLLRRLYPDRKSIPVGNPGADYDPAYKWLSGGRSIRNQKAREVLGREFIGFEKGTKDTVDVFERVYASYLNEAKT